MNQKNYSFLKGGGEMGELTRNFDWSQTSIGAPDTWPQSLKTIVSIILTSKFPMFLWWGPDLLQFYNDAFRPSLGKDEKRTNSLGQKGRDAWRDIWETIGPMIEGVLAGGEATWNEDVLIPIYRNGHYEDVHWTFSYSPVQDDEGNIEGVLCTCTETTKTVARLRKAEEIEQKLLSSEEYFKDVTDSVPAVLWMTGPDGSCTYLNKQWLAITGQAEDEALGFGWISATHPDDQDFVAAQFEKANREQNSFSATYRLRQQDGSYRWTMDKGTARFDPDGNYLGMIGTVIDVHERYIRDHAVNEAIKASESRFRALVEEAPVATCLFTGPGLVIEVANDMMLDLWGKDSSVIGLPLHVGVPELVGQPFLDILSEVYKTGITYQADEAEAVLRRYGKLSTYYFDFTYKPLFDEYGKVYGIMDMAVDVTDKVLLQKRLAESQKELLSYFEQSPVGIAIITEKDLTFTMANPFYGVLVGREPDQLIGKPLFEALPEIVGQGVDHLLNEVIRTGVPFIAREFGVDILREGQIGRIFVDLAYQPRREKDGRVSGVLVVATDVTENVLSRRKLEESEAQFKSLIEEAPVGTCLYVGEEMHIALANEIMLGYWGKDRSVIGLPMVHAMPEMAAQEFPRILQKVYRSGTTHEQKAARAELVVNGVLQTFYFDFTYKPLRNANNEIYAILDMAVDVTQQVKSMQELAEVESSLRAAIELAELGTWNYDRVTGTVTYSERLADWYGVDETAHNTMIAPGIHPDDQERFNDAVENALNPDSDGTIDVEYTAVNRSTGQRRILHLQGNTIYNQQGDPVALRGTTQDITIQRQHQMALEQEVQLRTEQLAAAVEELQVTNEELEESNNQLLHSNDELAQYAYVASHDLQEPLRKIRVFTSRLNNHTIGLEESKLILDKISRAAERMTLLIQDLLNFSRLLKNDSMVQQVDLNEIVHAVANDFELTILEKNATVKVGDLPVIRAVGLQMNQLFFNLVSNALKFVLPDVTPEIRIDAHPLTHAQAGRHIKRLVANANYYDITINDNGIGFETQFSEQIFEVFKRLHGREIYPGSGIGLALCRRIAGNHNGILYAESVVGEGTTFHLIVPDRQH